MSEQIIPASRKRIFLALYLDYLVLSPVLAVGLYLSTGQFEVPTWQELIVLSIYEAILYHVTDSPGFRLLSIRKSGRSMHPEGHLPVAADTLVVDPQVYFHEHWQTMLIGSCLLLKVQNRWFGGLCGSHLCRSLELLPIQQHSRPTP